MSSSINRTVKRKIASGEYLMHETTHAYLITDKHGVLKHTLLKSQVIEHKINEDLVKKEIVTIQDIPIHVYVDHLVLASRINCV